MKIFKKIGVLVLTAAFCLIGGTMSANNAVIAKAEASQPIAVTKVGDEVSPAGVFTNITVNLHTDGTYVWAEAKNEFTLFLATIPATVTLYSSETYTEDVEKMEFEASASVGDLDTGKSIIAKKAINGQQLYWRAQVLYKMDSNPWQTLETRTWLIAADGTVIG